MVFCAQCGTPGDGRFCTECGARLTSAPDSGGINGSHGASTINVEPPSYNPYAGESNAAAARAAHIGGTAFSTGPTSAAASSGGTSSGGTSSSSSGTSAGSAQPAPRSNIRGLSGSHIASGTSTGGTSAPAAPPQTASAGFVVNQPPASTPSQQESPTALFGSQGYRLDAFFYIAREIFVALDRSTQPVGTQMIEATKMRRFRELGGKSIPPYYETHVLPLYYQTIGAQCVGANVLSWEGWNTFLAHKILSGPDEMFAQLGAALRGLNLQLPWPLVRTDFPAYAYPDAAARELQFQQGIRDLAGSAIGGGHRHAVGRGGSNVAAGLARKSLMSLGSNFLFN
ncbi:hypothetical protein C8R44DRAFT_864260 [Mycena epipterygia]|nr:hypothetical protein C8R44DRAFT_864260 [Mycena epipterygia]